MPNLPVNIPRMCRHRASGQAVVRLGGRDYYLGPWGTAAAQALYHRRVAEWLASGSSPTAVGGGGRIRTIAELAVAYLAHVRQRYVKNGKPTSEVTCQKAAIARLVRLYADLEVDRFGPLALKACRQAMISDGMSRKTINQHVQRIRGGFRWAGEDERIDPLIHHRLQCVRGLRRGGGGKEPVRKATPAWADVERIADHLPPMVWAMVQVQWHTGMRPGEVRIMRTADVDRTGRIWLYRPSSYKSEHHHEREPEEGRVIAIGPRAQRVLRPWLRDAPEEYLFQPSEAEASRLTDRRAGRKTPRWPSHDPHLRAARKRAAKKAAGLKVRPRNRPGVCYSRVTYGQAIRRACEAAGVPAFGPHRLRHAFGTRARRQFDLEHARAALGHSDPNVTLIYAEQDQQAARQVAAKMG